MRRVIIESPYAGDVEKNLEYARKCLKDCLDRRESPLASHLLYTQVLDDKDDAQRRIGIEAGHDWLAQADAVVVYQDLGISSGMITAIEKASRLGIRIEFRKILGGV